MSNQETVFGPPGTGKTTATINRLAAQIEGGRSPGDVIYTAFTRVAADVARSRAADLAGTDSDQAFRWFGTLHAICGRLTEFDWRRLLTDTNAAGQAQLRAFGRSAGFAFEWGYDQDMESDLFTGQGAEGNLLLAWHAWARQCLMPPAAAARRWQQLSVSAIAPARMEQFAAAYEEFKSDLGVADFTDVLLAADDAQRVPPAPLLIVDEAQDLSPLQWRIVDRWAAAAEQVILAGDDDQAIYSFQGADAGLFLDRARTGRMTTLTQSYRLPHAPWQVATWLTDHIAHRQPKPFHPLHGPPGEVSETPLFRLPLAATLAAGETWFVLARNTKHLGEVRRHLEDEGIAYQSRRGFDPVAAFYPAAQAITTLARGGGIDHDALATLVRLLVPEQDYDPYLTRRLTPARRQELPRAILASDLEALGFTEAFRARLAREPIPVRMLTIQSRSGMRLVRSWQYLVRLATRYGNDVFSRTPAVTLSTIHGVKGDEADNVALLTDCARASLRSLDTDPDSEHRVWYVGATRARRRLFLLPPSTETNYWQFASGAWRQALAAVPAGGDPWR